MGLQSRQQLNQLEKRENKLVTRSLQHNKSRKNNNKSCALLHVALRAQWVQSAVETRPPRDLSERTVPVDVLTPSLYQEGIPAVETQLFLCSIIP